MTSPPREMAAPAHRVRPRPDRRPLGPVRRSVREVGLALITLGVIILLFVAYQLVGTNLTEERNQKALAKEFAAQLARPPAPAPTTTIPTQTPTPTAPTTPALPSAPRGGAIDHLVIPKIGVDKFVVEGTGEDALRHGPGHYAGTVYPGQDGNAAIAGHRTTYGAPFYRLNEVAVGDPIYVTDLNDHTWEYRVSRAPQAVSPSDVAVLQPTPFAQLTLTTCNPRFSASQRLIVLARLVGPAQPPPAPTPAQQTGTQQTGTQQTGTPQSSSSSTNNPAGGETSANPTLAGADNLGNGNSRAWTPAILYGGLVVLMWVLVRLWINRTRRWHRLAAYVVGIGVCLIPLWFCFENAVLLLPQSI